MKRRSICRRCHRVRAVDNVRYCAACAQALRQLEQRRPLTAEYEDVVEADTEPPDPPAADTTVPDPPETLPEEPPETSPEEPPETSPEEPPESGVTSS